MAKYKLTISSFESHVIKVNNSFSVHMKSMLKIQIYQWCDLPLILAVVKENQVNPWSKLKFY